MTAKALIEELKKVPSNAEIFVPSTINPQTIVPAENLEDYWGDTEGYILEGKE